MDRKTAETVTAAGEGGTHGLPPPASRGGAINQRGVPAAARRGWPSLAPRAAATPIPAAPAPAVTQMEWNGGGAAAGANGARPPPPVPPRPRRAGRARARRGGRRPGVWPADRAAWATPRGAARPTGPAGEGVAGYQPGAASGAIMAAGVGSRRCGLHRVPVSPRRTIPGQWGHLIGRRSTKRNLCATEMVAVGSAAGNQTRPPPSPPYRRALRRGQLVQPAEPIWPPPAMMAPLAGRWL